MEKQKKSIFLVSFKYIFYLCSVVLRKAPFIGSHSLSIVMTNN